jgi:UDP-N-acetylglucosamine:LPS N-acetylglucosamine transferase
VPYPYAGGHQRANAAAFVAAGAGLLIDDADCTPRRLTEALEHFHAPAARTAAAAAARSIARPDAADAIATILRRIASPRGDARSVTDQGVKGDQR